MKTRRINDFTLFEIPLIYLTTGLTWIIAGNEFLQFLTSDLSLEAQVTYRTYKGVMYVFVTTIMHFLLLKQQQKKLIGSEKQYRSLFANNPNPMYIFNMRTMEIIKVNNAALAKYGYTLKEFRRMTAYDIRPVDGKEKLDIAVNEYEGKHMCSGRWIHRKKSGEEFTVSIISHKVYFNNEECLMVLAIDITEVVENEKKIQEAYLVEKELNQALEHNNTVLEAAYKENFKLGEVLRKINNMVIVMDKDTRVSWVNDAFLDFSGYTFLEVKGKMACDLLSGPNSDVPTIKKLITSIESGKAFRGELLNYTKDKKEYWVELSVSPLFGENGELEGMISVENVITDRKEKEERNSTQNQALREIAWISSHRFRRPVASILSLTEMLNDEIENSERLEYLKLLKASSMELDEVSKEIAAKINQVENELHETTVI